MITRGRRWILSAGLVTVMMTSVAPSAGAVPEAKCRPGLANGISWDHSDPQYLQQISTVTWQNCKAVIRKVVLEWRSIDAQGGLADSWQRTFTADVVHKASGRQTYSQSFYVPNGYQHMADKVEFDLKSCTQMANGHDATALSKGVTFYTVATAYDKHGRKVLQRSSPPVSCDQNG